MSEPKAIVTVELHVALSDVSDFLSEWDSLVQRLIESAEVSKAEIVLPPNITTISLRRS